MNIDKLWLGNAMNLIDALYNQERKQNESLRYELFKDFLIDQFREDAIEEFWAILEVRNIEDWDSRLTEVLGEWDKEDKHFIIDVYNKINERG